MVPAPSRFVIGLAIFIAILAVSTASIFIRFAQSEAPSIAIAALRLSIASVVLAPVALTRHPRQLSELTRHELILAVVSGLFLGVHFATWITSLEYTTVASSVVLVSTGPLWVALLSPLFLNERLSAGAVVGLALALVGGAIIALGGSCTWDHSLACANLANVLAGHGIRGDLLALVGAWAVTGYLIIGRRLRAKIDLVPYVFLVYSVAGLSLLLAMWILRISALGFHPLTYLWLVLLALFPQLVGHSTYNWALRYLPAAIVAVTTLGEPIGSATLAYFFLHERPTIAVLVGGVLILGGIYIAVGRQGKAGDA
ncbi:MAG TPA: DMT family transporter [Anaerolineales bacterium]